MFSQNKIMPRKKTGLFWDGFSAQDWEKAYEKVPRANLLQSTPYAVACAKTNYQTIRQGLFYIDDQPAALLQILEAGFLNKAVHGIILDRGPLWFENYGSDESFALFLESFRAEFPARLGRKIRFIPEVETSENIKNLLNQKGFRQNQNNEPYKTIWLNLQPDLETLKANQNKKWRNALNKSANQKLKITSDTDPKLLSWFLNQYEADKSAKAYQGASLKLLINLRREFSGGKNALTLYALFDERPIAAILIFIHGTCATYQIGYTSDLGRKKCAHNALLWHALEVLKERNIHEIDLGGIIGEEDGLTKFKKGMGGTITETPGLFIG